MARSAQFVAAAALSALLPTPCLIVLPASFASPSKPKPGRADAAERWDAHKTGAGGATPPPTKRRDAGRGRGLCRADECDSWDSNKTSSTSPSRSSSSSSSEPFRQGSSSSSRSPARSSSSRASSDERWDIHKKPRVQAALDGEKRESSNAVMITSPAIARAAEFAGPSFVSPEPGMLPLPMFLMAR